MGDVQELQLEVGDRTAEAIQEDFGAHDERHREHRLLAHQREDWVEPVHILEDVQRLRDTFGDWTAENERPADATAFQGVADGEVGRRCSG